MCTFLGVQTFFLLNITEFPNLHIAHTLMTLQQFIQNFEAQFEEIEPNTLSEDTPFRSLE